jgi:hypothetical protein
MRTVLFILFILVLVAGGLYWKNHGKIFNKDDKVAKVFAGEPIATRWDTILIGSWHIFEGCEFTRGKWDIDSDIDFLPDRSFKMYTTGRYFQKSYSEYSTTPDEVNGGSLTGHWRSQSEDVFAFLPDDCQIPKSPYVNCDHFKTLYGTYSDAEIKNAIVAIGSHEIEIRGQNYRTGAQLYYRFYKK